MICASLFHFNKDADLHAILVLTKRKTRWSIRWFAGVMSKRQQRNLPVNFGFQKKSKTNNSEELRQIVAWGPTPPLQLRTCGDCCWWKPTTGPGVTMIQDELTEAGDGVKDSSEAADDGDSTCLSLPAKWTSQQWREYVIPHYVWCERERRRTMYF